MILCRVNAPLIETAYTLIARGVPAHIKGRDIAEGMDQLIDKAEREGECATVRGLLKNAEEVTRREAQRFMEMPDGRGEMRASAAMDRLACLIAAARECGTVSEVKAKIQKLFDESAGGVVLGTVHKLKGAEAKRVWILKPELMPHPRATQPHEIQGEKNVLYVAITRTKFTQEFEGQLTFVGDIPGWLK